MVLSADREMYRYLCDWIVLIVFRSENFINTTSCCFQVKSNDNFNGVLYIREILILKAHWDYLVYEEGKAYKKDVI